MSTEAERYDTKSNVKLGGFQSQLKASCVSSHTNETWFNETLCLWMTIYTYIHTYISKLPRYLLIALERIDGFMPVSRILALCEI